MVKFIKDFLTKHFCDITIEPVILLYILGASIVSGSEVPTNVLMYKICIVEMNFTDSVCKNLTELANVEIQKDIQIRFFIMLLQGCCLES
jgi:hypothetical protein